MRQPWLSRQGCDSQCQGQHVRSDFKFLAASFHHNGASRQTRSKLLGLRHILSQLQRGQSEAQTDHVKAREGYAQQRGSDSHLSKIFQKRGRFLAVFLANQALVNLGIDNFHLARLIKLSTKRSRRTLENQIRPESKGWGSGFVLTRSEAVMLTLAVLE